MEKVSKKEYIINFSFIMYFIILFTERSISLILSIIDESVDIYGSFFNGYTYTITMISLLASIMGLLVLQPRSIVGLFTTKKSVYEKIDFKKLSLLSGLLLFSGMVHTQYTILMVQFVAYGFLLLAMIFQTIIRKNKSDNKTILWLSTFYVIAYSMAIPVIYDTTIRQRVLFYIVEIITCSVTILFYMYMLIKMFSDTEFDYFKVLPILFMTVFDVILIILRWQEMINVFVLVFLIISLILWLIGFIMTMKNKKKKC